MHTAQEQEWIVIRGWGSLSGLGCSSQEIVASSASGKNTFTYLPHLGINMPVSPVSAAGEATLNALCLEKPEYSTLDRSVQLAIAAARLAVTQAGWKSTPEIPIGVNIGSSRGATGLFEKFYQEFLENPVQRLSPGASPSTTLGNLASWVANDLNTDGPALSHSVTCSTAFQAFANGVAWLKAGMAKRFLVGGTEAPLTPFTLAQMKAVGIYTKFSADQQPCRPLNPQGINTFTLGEGAAVCALERMTDKELKSLPPQSVFVVAGIGLGFERIPSKTGISPEGEHFQKSMKEALAQAHVSPGQLDGLVVHAPGTRAGDSAEVAAVKAVFGNALPPFFSNKHQIGHTLGASGALSVAWFLELLAQNQTIMPLDSYGIPVDKAAFKHILFNSAGFGGNAASLLIKKVST